MKKILKPRNGKLASVYAWAVEYSLKKAKERKECVKLTKMKIGKPTQP